MVTRHSFEVVAGWRTYHDDNGGVGQTDNREKAEDRLEQARDRFTGAVAELHAALAELQAATLEASAPERTRTEDTRKTVGVTEAAEIMNVSRQTIHRWAKEGKLRAVRLGLSGRFRISTEDLRRLAGDPRLDEGG